MDIGCARERPTGVTTLDAGTGATRPLSCAGPTAKRWRAGDSPARTDTASRRPGCAMEGGTAPTEEDSPPAMRPTRGAKRSVPTITSSNAPTTSASTRTKNAMDGGTVAMAAMRLLRYAAEPERRLNPRRPSREIKHKQFNLDVLSSNIFIILK